MADSGLFIGFGPPVRGRERQAIAVFNEAFEYYSRLQQEGEIDSFEPVLLEPHGGDMDGFVLLRGDQDKLAGIRGGEEFQRQAARAQLIADSRAARRRGGRVGVSEVSIMFAYGSMRW